MPRRWPIHTAMILTVLGCGEPRESDELRAPSSPPQESARSAAPEVGRFELHEWGLFAATTRDGPVVASTSVSPDAAGGFGGLGLHGTGVGGGKPVIYVHLDEGVPSAELTVWLEAGEGSRFVEAWPRGTHTSNRLAFVELTASRGACDHPTAPPSGTSPECTGVADGFCEAAEIPRYHGDDDVCLRHGDVASELLFYRADGLPEAPLPIHLVSESGALAIRRMQSTPVAGPILVVTRGADQQVSIRRLDSNEASGRLDSLPGTSISSTDARAALLAHARASGLTEREADAFIDAWAPAFFEPSRREGPAASGTPPPSMRSADRSILYFAPRATIDRMLALRSTPAARATSRVFLVRIVDADASVAESFGGPIGTIGGGIRTTSPSRVRVEPSTATHGGLAPDVIRRVFQRNISQLRHCHELGLARTPTIAGRVQLRLSIRTDGSVERSEIGTSTIRDESVKSCVAAAARRWAFPPNETRTTATVPISFEIAEDR